MAMEEGDEPEIQIHNENNVLYEAKLREILRNLCSIEATLFVAAAKEFVRLLKSVSGGEWLRRYVEASTRCSEINEVWKLRQGKPGMAHLLHLVSAILGHPIGMSRSEVIHKSLDRFAGSIIETKLGDINTELDSKEPKRQRYALLALAAVVRRSSYLASEVAKVFDFKKLTKARLKGSVRRAFVEFAMSFLESGNPGLRGWVLQQKEVNECVLHKLAKDDEETVVLVLSTLRDRVLCEESLVRAPLRSVLFGSRTLEQLIEVSGREASVASKIAHKVLLMVCTDPRNGLMPGPGLKGNDGRLLDLMKKLKATEIKRHGKLLLAIVKGRPSLGSDYMEEFPYHLEPRSSPLWFSAISLAADLVMSMRVHPSFAKDPSRSEDPPVLDDPEVQCILKRIIPRALNRSMMNKGLLHSDILVKHSSLRLLLESLKSVDLLFSSLDDVIMNMSLKQETETSNQRTDVLGIFPGSESFINAEKFLNSNVANVIGDDKMKLVRQKWVSLKQDIQDEIRAVFPDHQTLLNLLSATKKKKSPSSSNDSHSENSTSCLKRCRNSTDVECRNGAKKLKTSPSVEDVDVIVGGIYSELSIDVTEGCDGTEDASYRGDLDAQQNDLVEVSKIWGIHDLGTTANEFEDARIFFLSKLLDVLTLYMRAVPVAFDESFDFFKLLSDNPSSLCSGQLRSLLSLLVEYIGKSHGSKGYSTVSESMYKHLKSLIDIIIYSPVKDIQDQAYILAKSAMLSTGAFDQNLSEIDAWLLFLPGYSRGKCTSDIQGTRVFSNLSGDVVKFLCDAVSTTGNNLYKHFDQMRKAISRLEDIGDASPGFGPLIICILEKCLRVLDSSSGTSKKSVISSYVCNTLSYLMQNQILGSVDKILGNGNADEHMGIGVALSSAILCANHGDLLEHFPSLIAISRRLFGSHFPFLFNTLFLGQKFFAEVANLWPDMFLSGMQMAVESISPGCPGVDVQIQIFAEDNVYTNGNRESDSAAAFALLLKHVPFYILFPAIMNIGNSNLLHSKNMLDLLEAKLLEGKDLFPILQSFYIVSALMRFISPFDLLEIAHWIFRTFDQDDLADKCSGISLLDNVYYKIIDLSICFRLECADLCLMKAVNAVYSLKFTQPPPAQLPLSMAMEDYGEVLPTSFEELLRLLEVFMLRNIVQLCMEIQSDLIKLQNVLFLEQFIRSSLLHRFEDPVTLRAIRNILVTLSEGKISSAQNMPSILKSIDILPKYHDGTNGNGMHNASSEPIGCDSYKRKMELIKLLRVLYYLGAQQRHMYPGNVDKNNRELLSLLLAGYGATLCETDLEMFHLMQEIESFEESDCRNIAEMDYLWGDSALNIRKEQTQDRLVSCNSTVDSETVDERRKRFFGENIPVDPKLCAATVLHFCYDADASTVPMSVENLQQESLIDIYQSSSSNVNRVRQYDPAFLLRFSVHSLMTGYMEPVEFVRLGLLAIAFVSMSSSDEEMRKLGDKTLNIFKTTLEIVRKSVKFPKQVVHLVEQCGLLSWLSSIITSCGENLHGNQKGLSLTQMSIALQVDFPFYSRLLGQFWAKFTI
ncbi:hypothetical protein QJS04_geneDACA018223 [Acorus gramineus]|uniref:URB1 N-terminal domain-containing protein n=1 Tax=Acorus gramineus TaxID=55184 RepID=A0AAV9BXW3_ACOGR|nr:hypothetical protein QJS04_geneDACA018223 [Acorus gramineus]